MRKRILAVCLTLVLALSLLPANALANGAGDEPATYSNKAAATAATGVTANKTAARNDDGTYTITLSVSGYTETGSSTANYPADVVLVLDTSYSMDDCTVHSYLHLPKEDCVTRLDLAKTAATSFVTGLLYTGSAVKVGFADFNKTSDTQVALTDTAATLTTAIDGLTTSRNTRYNVGLNAASSILSASTSASTTPQFIVFISDGEPNKNYEGVTEAAALKNAGVTIMTVGIDLSDNQAAKLKNISSTGANNQPLYFGTSSAGLSNILAEVQKSITTSLNAGTGAVMTDIINTTNFELVENSADKSLTVGENGTLTWNIGDIGQTTQTATFKVKLLDGNTATGALPTNSDVSLTFKSAKLGKDVTFDKGAIAEPTVNVYSVTYTDGVDGEEVFADQTTYNLAAGDATPAFNGTPEREGYTFSGWSPTVSTTVGAAAYDIVYTATWAQLTYAVTGTIDNGGTVTNGSQTVTHGGTSAEMVFTPAEHYWIASVTVNNAAVGDPAIGEDGAYTYPAQENVAGNIAVAVTTEQIPYTVTYNKGANGTLEGQDADGNVTTTSLHYGDATPAAPAVTAAEGYYFAYWSPTVTDTVTGSVTYTAQYAPMGTVTITGDSGTRTYNGTEQTLTAYTVLPTGYAVEDLNYSASGTDAGTYNGVFSGQNDTMVVKDAQGEVVTGRVSYKFVPGTLTIQPVAITVTAGSATKEHDSTPLTCSDWEITSGAFVEDEGLSSVTVTGSQTDVGSSLNKITAYELNENTKAQNYAITVVDGTLTVTAGTPVPAGFDFDDADGDGEPGDYALYKTVSGTLPRGFEEDFTVTVAPNGEREAATLSRPASLTGTAAVTDARYESVPFEFTGEWPIGTDSGIFVRGNQGWPGYDLTFHEAGTYTYTVRESKGGTERMSYDTAAYTLTITVGLNEKENALEVTSWTFSGNRDAGTPLTIVNAYRTYRYTPRSETKPTLNTDDHFAYLMGYPDGTVRPEGSITRAEAATIFFRLLSDESREEFWSTANAYSDVKRGDWFNNAVSTLSSAGVVSGYPDGTFRPNAPITRAEMAKLIALFAKLDKSEDRFNDIAGHWAEAYIRLAAGNGWLEGYPDGSFRPQQSITRAETVTMINRVLERVPSDEDHLLDRDEMLTFPDNRPAAWYYIAIQEAANSHTYQRAVTEKDGDEQWIQLRTNRDWTELEM